MAGIIYYLSLPFIYLLSLLPFPVLYFFSDLLCFVLFKVIGYRKNVVIENLKKSFPEKTEKEIEAICSKFYSYLCDLTLETFKTLTISKQKMLDHCSINEKSKKIFETLEKENISFIVVLGHFGNWEWAGNTFSLACKHQLYVIYHPLTNKYFNSLMYNMRTRFGTRLIAMKNVYKEMLAHKNTLNATAFIADQTPSHQNVFWVQFLNQDTAVFKGTEIIAKKLNLPVVYISLPRIKRGIYEMNATLLFTSPATTEDGEITTLHTQQLEKDIIAQPEIWLWSHRRWKQKRNQ